jgi:hypothetical protein
MQFITLVNTEHLFGQQKDVLTLTSWKLESLGIAVSDFGRKQKHLFGQE